MTFRGGVKCTSSLSIIGARRAASLIACKLPPADLFASWFAAASILVTAVLFPFSLIVTCSSKALRNTVVQLSVPRGLPFGFPDAPFWKRLFIGGFLKPTSKLGDNIWLDSSILILLIYSDAS